MKRFFAFFLCLVMICACVSVRADDYTPISELRLKINVPEAGTYCLPADPAVLSPANSCTMTDKCWVNSNLSGFSYDDLTSPIVAGNTYYLYFRFEAADYFYFDNTRVILNKGTVKDSHYDGSSTLHVYIEVKAEDTSKMIDDVSFTFTPPAAGASTSSVSPDVTVAQGKHYELQFADWVADKDANPVTSEITFEEGKTYYFYAIFSAENSYDFDSPTTISCQGTSLVDGPDFDRSGNPPLIAAAFSFTLAKPATPIEKVSVTVTPPAAGSTAATKPTVTLPSDAKYTLNQARCNWLNDQYCDHYDDHQFTAGETCRAYICLTPDEGYEFNDGTTITIDGGDYDQNQSVSIRENDILCFVVLVTVKESQSQEQTQQGEQGQQEQPGEQGPQGQEPSQEQPAKQDKITITKAPSSLKAKVDKTKKASGKNAVVLVSWKNIKETKKTKALLKQIRKIEVQYATDAAFTQNVKSKKLGKNATSVSLKLKKKTTYYFRVRYVGADGCSNWSKAKKVKTK